MLRTSLTAFVALTLISSTAQASPYASSVKIAAAPGYATPGEPAPAPAPAPAPQPYAGQPTPAPQPYADPGPQPYAQPGPAPYAQPGPYQPPPPQQRRRGKGMMIGGWTLFGASYLTTAMIGAIISDTTSTCDNVTGEDDICNRHRGAALFVPVVGPLIGIRSFDETAIGAMFGVVSFLAQSAGLAMGIAGTVLFVRDGKQRRAAQQAGLHLGRGVHLRAAPRLDGATLDLSYRF